jgi:hypothetical protein
MYLAYATLFPLNSSYKEMDPYRGAFYWRFLYEKCGGMQGGVEDPSTGMEIIRHVLTALYSGEIVDIRESTDLVGSLPAVMDLALSNTPSCPFRTFQDSLASFSSAIYGLRLAGGRCIAPGLPEGCGLYDPNSLYRAPLTSQVSYSGEMVTFTHAEQPYPAGIGSSFGVDFVEVALEPPTDGGSLVVELYGEFAAGAEFGVQLVKLTSSGHGDESRVPSSTTPAESFTRDTATGRQTAVVSGLDSGAFNRLGLVITRLDNHERSDPVGAYTLVIRPAEAVEVAGAENG